MIKILIQNNENNQLIFTICFNFRNKVNCIIDIYDPCKYLKDVKNKMSNGKNNLFNNIFYDNVCFDNYNIILKNNIYYYNLLFDNLKLIDIFVLSDFCVGTSIYKKNNIDYNFKFIDDTFNLNLDNFKRVELKLLNVKRLNNIDNLRIVLYGFPKSNSNIDIRKKMRLLNKIKNIHLYYDCPNYLDEPYENKNYVDLNIFKRGYNNIKLKSFDFDRNMIKYIKILKSNKYVKNYINKLKIYYKVRFLRLYSMIKSIKKSINLVMDNINEINDSDIILLVRYDVIKLNPNIKYFYDIEKSNYYFGLRKKFYPSCEDRILVINKKILLMINKYLDDFDNNLESYIKNKEIFADNGIFSVEIILRNLISKYNYLYQFDNFNISKMKVNKKKNSKEIFKYYDKLWNSVI